MIGKSFYQEMEKISIDVASTLFGAFSASQLPGAAKEMQEKTKLSPPTRAGQAGLNTPYSNQFAGSNRTDSSGSRYPISSLYQ